ncbi:MAG: NUDIX hydrolase [Anaerolineales bacterium]|nr:NUDIX hydrolase [Anaerolineales bacterium]
MNDKAYQASLPKKRMAAGALFWDENGRILLVNPTYKEPWEIPGGSVEALESPRQACMREIKEELGLDDWQPQRLLCVDYVSQRPDKTESLQFIFAGGLLDAALIGRLALPPAELSEYRFCLLAEALTLVNRRLGRRIAHCLFHLDQAGTLYLEDGEVP